MSVAEGTAVIDPKIESVEEDSCHPDHNSNLENDNPSRDDTVSREELVDKIQNIRQLLMDEYYKQTKAQEEANWLYTQAEQLVHEEVWNKSLFAESVLPIVVVYGDVMELIAKKELNDIDLVLFRDLTRAYRLFIELTWYQCWREERQEQDRWPISDEVLRKILSHAEFYCKMLENKAIENKVIDVRFEWKCIEQAAHCLPSVKNPPAEFKEIMQKELTFPPQNFHFPKVVCHCKTLKRIVNSSNQKIADWYPDVQKLHWYSICIRNQGGFQANIEPEIKECRCKGGAYGVCLAISLMRMIDASDDEALRKRAFSKLKELARWNQGTFKSLLRRKDPFKNVRILAVQYLWEIYANQNKAYGSLHEESSKELSSLFENLKSKFKKEDNEKIKSALAKPQNKDAEDEHIVQCLLARV